MALTDVAGEIGVVPVVAVPVVAVLVVAVLVSVVGVSVVLVVAVVAAGFASLEHPPMIIPMPRIAAPHFMSSCP